MRITNKMMTDNVLYNINNNKNQLNKLSNQYTTGKKIEKPSDDPIVAVRALKLRTNLSELNQYYEKNIPDALQWMSVTEKSMTTLNTILKEMNTYCNQGANDTLTASDRKSIVTNLQQLTQQIYQEGNSNYAGRYVFSGYKTDSSLIFNDTVTNLTYDITEELTGEDIDIITSLVGDVQFSEFDRLDPDKWDTDGYNVMPTTKDIYRLRLAYNELSDKDMTGFKVEYTDKDGNVTTKTFPDDFAGATITKNSSTDADAYTAGDDEVHYIYNTGELVIGANLYNQLRTASKISVDYEKSKFYKNDLMPEHYFKCTRKDSTKPGVETTFEKHDQEIKYEVNFNQMLKVNTEGKDVFTHALGRVVSEIESAVQDVNDTEDKIAELNKLLEDTSISDETREKLGEIKEQLDSEFTLKTSIMREKFAKALTTTEKEQDYVDVALSDVGGRYNRLLMTQSRLSSQQVDFNDLLSTNEEVDIVDTYVKYTSAQTIYNASLSSVAKLTKSSLLDFI